MSTGGEVVYHESIPSCDSEITRMPPLWRGFLRSRLDLAWPGGIRPRLSTRAAADVFASQRELCTLHPRVAFSWFEHGEVHDPSPEVFCCNEI